MKAKERGRDKLQEVGSGTFSSEVSVEGKQPRVPSGVCEEGVLDFLEKHEHEHEHKHEQKQCLMPS